MEKDVERKLLAIEIRTLASNISREGGQNPLEALGVNLDEADIMTLRQIRSHFRDLVRSLGGSRGQ